MNHILALTLLLFLSPLALANADGPAIYYHFDSEAMRLNGKSDFIEVPGADDLHIGPDGLSVVATVRFAPAADETAEHDVDMILFKEREFLVGRLGDKLYFNLHDGADWKSHVLAGPVPRGQWCHVVVTVTRQYEPAQGVNGYTVRMLLNGELIKEVELRDREVPVTSNPVTVGRGFGGPWFFHGELAELAVYPRALLDDEIDALLAAEKLATVKMRHVTKPDPRYASLRNDIRSDLQHRIADKRLPLEWLLAAVGQASAHVASEADLVPFLETVKKLSAQSMDPIADFTAAHPEFTFLDNGQLGLVFFGMQPSSVTLCGLYDFTTQQELLGRQRELWSLHYAPAAGGGLPELESLSASVKASLSVDRLRNEAALVWRHTATEKHPFIFSARARLRLDGRRVSLDFDVANTVDAITLREVVFPIFRFRQLHHGIDRLLVPKQSGVLNDKPVANLFRYEGNYPSGNAHMQFFSYYDERQGLYVACEDPLGRSKTLRASAAGDDCQISFLWVAGSRAGGGGNSFAASGQAVVEAFDGDWFDAAQRYKRFARTAAWWPASRLREDTPQWYRNLSVWFQGRVNTEQDVAELIAMRDYVGLPIGVHAYDWSEATWPSFTGHPHFTPPKPGFATRVGRLKAHSVHVKPYINARLWDTHDRDTSATEAESAEYLRVAKPHGIKLRDQGACIEEYEGRKYAVMCPATRFWQDTVKQLCGTVAEYGVDAIYFDQIAAGAPAICVDPTHPHDAGSGETWLEQGYWPMLSAIRSELKPRYPLLAFDSEDAAEPYMHLLDGFLPWRFIDVGHVPAYQAIYAGRVQMTGRVNTAEPKAKFVVAAEQMLSGEQIGWFGVSTLQKDPQLGLFVKKLAHLRQAFLRFFNEGDMLKPATWAAPLPSVTADWGYFGPRVITTPALLHSVWRSGDTTTLMVVNTTAERVSGDLVPPPTAWGLPGQLTVTEFLENQPPQTAAWSTANPLQISVPGHGVAAWLIGADDSEIAAVAAVVQAISGFTPQP